MPLVTCISDWNQQDYYLGLLKGRLKTEVPELEIMDLNHSIAPFHAVQASFILRQVISHFPPGTIHLMLVNLGHNPEISPVVASYRSQYVIGWDDDSFPLIFQNPPDHYLLVEGEVLRAIDTQYASKESATIIHPAFPEIYFFPMLVRGILNGMDIKAMGPDSFGSDRSEPVLPAVQNDWITGQVVYIDSYHNAISNISKELFHRNRRGRSFEILIKSNHYRLDRLHQTYFDSGEPGDLIALFNSIDLLEIAIIQGNVAELLGLETGSTIKIIFYGEEKE